MHKRLFVFLATTMVAVAVFAGMSLGARQTKPLHFDNQGEARKTPFVSGVAVHFGIGGEYNYDAARSAAAIEELGFGSYRDDLPWSLFEAPEQGPYGERPKRLYGFMKQSSAKPVLILGHPNDKVKGGNPPIGEDGQAAFAAFAADAAEAMAPLGPTYEIWNEWNMNAVRGQPWLRGAGPASDPRAATHYASLAKKSVAAIRRKMPTAEILVGAVGVDEGWGWTKAVVEDGVLDGADGLSVHLYNQCDPNRSNRTATNLIDKLIDLQTFLTEKNNGRPYPVYVTEYGWPAIQNQCFISLEDASDQTAQFMLWSFGTPWVMGSWVYQLKESDRDKSSVESGFGLLDYDYGAKPVACAMKEVNALIASASETELVRPDENNFLLKIRSKSGLKLIAWTRNADTQSKLTLKDGEALESRPLCGAAQSSKDVVFGQKPVVIDLPSRDAYDFVFEADS